METRRHLEVVEIAEETVLGLLLGSLRLFRIHSMEISD